MRVFTWIFGILVALIVIGTMCGENTPEKELTPIEKCFSQWDGSAPAFAREIKAGMLDPKSYEHIETRYKVKPGAGNEGTMILYSRYRGKNAFGGLIIAEASGEMLIDGCVLTKIRY